TFVLIGLMPLLQSRKNVTAWTTPGSPEIQQHNLPAQLRKFNRSLIYPLRCDDFRQLVGSVFGQLTKNTAQVDGPVQPGKANVSEPQKISRRQCQRQFA